MLNNPLINVDPDGDTEYQINITIDKRTGKATLTITTTHKIAYGKFKDVKRKMSNDSFKGFLNYNFASLTIINIDENGKKTV